MTSAAVKGLADLSFEESGDCHASGYPVDGIATIKVRGTVLKEPYIIKQTIRADFIHLLSLLRREKPSEALLLVTGYVTDKASEQLRAANIHFVDMAGNVFLAEKDLYLFVSGRRLNREDGYSSDGNKGRAFNPSGLKLIFNLLTDEHLDATKPGLSLVGKPYREISKATGIVTSTIGWIMADLIQHKYVIQVSAGHRMLVDRVRLLDRWVEGYHERLRPSLLLGRYQPRQADWWRNAVLENGLWSGETAAARVTQSIKPQTATIFGGLPSNAFVLKHQLQKDPAGSVEFLKPFWAKPNPEKAVKLKCVHPLLIYADLLSIDDDRTREVAKIIYEHHIHPIIKAD
jgi:hypothetical protein